MSIKNISVAKGRSSRWRGVYGAWRTVAQAFAALTAGSRIIPMGDNGELLRALAARAGRPRNTPMGATDR